MGDNNQPLAEASDIYQRSIAEWVARRFRLEAARIRQVEFTTYHGGACDTCEYDATGISFYYRTGKTQRSERHRTEELPEMTAARFFQECSEIKMGLEGR